MNAGCKLAALLFSVLCLLTASASQGGDFRARLHNTSSKVGSDDVRAEVQFGREVAARVLGRHGLVDNEDLARYVNLVGRSVAFHADRADIEFHFAVLDTDSINAYAAPGGYVFVTRGALDRMRDESELAAVIAHEIAHVNGRHIVKELNIQGSDESPVAGFARFIGGSGDPAKLTFLTLVDKAVEILFERGYRIEDERKADSASVLYLALSGYDPSALKRYFRRIKDVGGDEVGVLRNTHPSFDERITALDMMIREEKLAGMDFKKGEKRFNEVKKDI